MGRAARVVLRGPILPHSHRGKAWVLTDRLACHSARGLRFDAMGSS